MLNGPYFHAAFVVPDLDQAMASLTELLGVGWWPIRSSTIDIAFDGRPRAHVTLNVVYTAGDGPAIELIEQVPGTPFELVDGQPRFHHLGCWADDVSANAEQLLKQGSPVVAGVFPPGGDVPTATFHAGPVGGYVEFLDSAVQRPWFRALRPSGYVSPEAGE